MKHKRKILIILLSAVFFLTCETNPLTGETNFYLFSNSELFAMSEEAYREFLAENPPITGTADAVMVKRVGDNIRDAAIKWYTKENNLNYLKEYIWEYHLVASEQVNAWCMPGGRIVVYQGLLPVTQNEDALATVMGHEVAHALLDHGKQRVSWGYVQQLGAELGMSVIELLLGPSEDTQKLFLLAYGLGTNLGLMLPFSRANESEADEYGLYLMAIAGYKPEKSTEFWERMAAGGSSGPEFLSTHPSHETRINDLKGLIPKAQAKAIEVGIIK